MSIASVDAEKIGARSFGFPVWGSALLALAASTALTFAQAQKIWSTGAFFDTDDAMRAVQVRDLLAGQSWFDMTVYRLDPPRGVFSHWSRIVDAPLAATQLFFRLFLSPETAEIATRLLFPLGLLGALFLLSPWFARVLAPNASRHIAVLLALLSGENLTQFVPGRIDHHAPGALLLLVSLGFYLQALDPRRARLMLAAGAAMALSFAICLENLPFFAIMLAATPLLFVIDGARMQAPLAWLAVALATACPAAYALTVGPSRYLVAACDAYSSPYLAGLLVGAAGMGLLALLAPRLLDWRARAIAVAVAGVAAVATFLLIAPQCLGDPLGGIDPLARELWLSHVTEAWPLWFFWAKKPATVVAMGVPVLLALLTALVAGARSGGEARRRWLITGALIAVGALGGIFWQVRIFTSVTPIAMAALCLPVAAAAESLTRAFSPLTRALTAAAICLAVSPIGLGLFAPASATGAATEEADAAGGTGKKLEVGECRKPEVLSRLTGFAPARVAASFDFGPYLLAYTPLSVFSGPYHRDNHGNRIVIDAFLADAGAAEQILRQAGADLVLWCPAETAAFAKRAPNGLAAMLSRGEAPAWLERREIDGVGPLQVYALK